MTTDSVDAPAGDVPASLAERVGKDVATLTAELAEIDLLVQQARVEAERHELKRAQAAERLESAGPATPAADTAAQNAQLVVMTKRAVLMEAQVDVLEGKRKSLVRYRDALAEIARELGEVGPAELAARAASDLDAAGMMSPASSRVVLGAQEDLRREIARAMHDGPAQSLTNIVLQAQIVERLVTRDPAMASGEVRLLVSMVQQTLDATKSFIFDVRPMVLDDLGLVPTLRRSARERGKRAGIPVEFESLGQDRRLSFELESGLFRILDEALVAYLATNPDRLLLSLDWSDQVEARLTASRTPAEAEAEVGSAPEPAKSGRRDKGKEKASEPKELPPALAAMVEDRRVQAEAAAQAARDANYAGLAPSVWREIRQRAETIGVSVELLDDGAVLRVVVDAPPPETAAEAAPAPA